jgi:acetyl esterase/lipase
MKATSFIVALLFASLPACKSQAQPPPAGTRTLRDLAYVPGGHERQKLDLYLPANTNGARPLILWIHGGAWRGGSKDKCPAVRFVAQGYAVASANYRLSHHAAFPAQVEDCKAAVRWLRAHAKEYGLDPDRFGAWGSSAGGHLVALLGTTGGVGVFDRGPNLEVSSRVQCVVDFFGPTDLARMAAQSGPESRMNHDAPDSPESLLIGGAVPGNKDKAAKASPITYVSRDDPPMLLVHGDADPLVPWQQSEELDAALRKSGVEATLHIVKGGGHGNGFGPEVQQAVNVFFERHLKQSAESPKK